MAFPRDFGWDVVPGPVDSTPGMGIDEPADPIRMVGPPIGIAAGRVGDVDRGGRPHPDGSAGTAGRSEPHGRGMIALRPGVCGGAPGRGTRAGPAGRDPTDTAPPPVGGRSRAGTAAGTDERSGRDG